MTYARTHNNLPTAYVPAVLRPAFQRRGILALFFLGLALGPLRVNAQKNPALPDETLPLLTNASEVVQLPAEQAARHYPVRVRGVMTYVDPHNQYGFVQDDTAGAVVFWTNSTPPIPAGEFVEISGQSASNIYSAVIYRPEFGDLGPHDFPKPLKASFSQLYSGQADCQWIEVDGTVRSATTNADYLILELAVQKQRFKVSILATNEPDPEHWVEAHVRIRGVACGSFNNKNQFVTAELLSPSMQCVTTLAGTHVNPYTLPVTPLSTLGHKSEKPPGQRIHVRGVVTLPMPGEALYVRDGAESIEVRTTQRSAVKPGDMIDVIGFYERTESSLVIEDANFRVASGGPAPAPMPVTVEQLNTGRLDAELVTLPATVLEWRHGSAERTVSLQVSNVVFNARLDNGPEVDEFSAGSRVQVTGVCLVKVNRNLDVQSFELHLRSPADLVLVQRAGWWTTRHVFWLAGALLLAGIFAAGWAGVLIRANSRLEERVAQRTEAFKRESSERERVEAELRESKSLYLSLVEHLPVGIYRKDAQGRFTFANTRYAAPNGTTPDEILGRTFQEIMPKEIADAYSLEDEEILRTGKTMELDKEYRAPGREPRHLHVVKTPVFNDALEAVGTQGMVVDITERKLAEAQLAFERDLLRSLLESSPDHIYFKDLQSRFIKCSQKQIERFGLESEEGIIGKTDFNFFGEDHARAAFEDEQQIIRTGRPVVGKLEKESWKAGGKVTWVLTSKLPLRTKAGKIIGTFGISKDITDIKEAEAKLELVHTQLVDASRKAGMAEVATSVLHNVGNVLNSVNTSASVLAEHLRVSKISSVARVSELLEQNRGDMARFLTEDTRGTQLLGYLKALSGHLATEQALLLRELAELTKNIDHIKEIVSTQQSYARVAGVVERLPVTPLVEDALRMHAGALARHHVDLVRQYQDVPEILVDKHKVLQILVNLISNAKYALAKTEAERRTLIVGVGLTDGGRLRITVKDNGMGIARENLTRIFSHGFTTRAEGHGFGLHSGALDAKGMGGSLSVESDGPGKGATFTLELPLEPPSRPGPGVEAASGFATNPDIRANGRNPVGVA